MNDCVEKRKRKKDEETEWKKHRVKGRMKQDKKATLFVPCVCNIYRKEIKINLSETF